MSVDDAIARFDWLRIQTYVGNAEMLPAVVRRLIAARNRDDAHRIGDWIERIVLSVAGPSEACLPVATVLVAALPDMTPAGHSVALDLLTLIGTAEISRPPHEQIGAVDINEIRRATATGFHHYIRVLQADSAEADLCMCIDLVAISALHDPSLTAAATAALRAVPTSGRSPHLAQLVRNTLDDLISASTESP
jgi:hypothetical protein